MRICSWLRDYAFIIILCSLVPISIGGSIAIVQWNESKFSHEEAVWVDLTVSGHKYSGAFFARDTNGEEYYLSFGKGSNANKLIVGEDKMTLLRVRRFLKDGSGYTERFCDVNQTVGNIVRGR